MSSEVERLVEEARHRVRQLGPTTLIEAENQTDLRIVQGLLNALAAEQSSRLQAERERDEARAELDREEAAHGTTIDQRDAAEAAIGQAYYLITGRSPEWSNTFGFAEALEEIDDAQTLLRLTIKAAEALAEARLEALKEVDGGWLPIVLCPTDGEWRLCKLRDGREVVAHFDGGPLSRRRWQTKAFGYHNPARPTGQVFGGVEQMTAPYDTFVISDLPEGVYPTHFRPNDTVHGRAALHTQEES